MKRIVAIDVLRGVCLVVMVCDHYMGAVRKLLYQTLGFFSAAEAFAFVSGMVACSVYARYTERRCWAKLYARARVLYRYHLRTLLSMAVLFALFQGFAKWAGKSPSYALLQKSPLVSLTKGMVFLYQPTYVHLLPMYCFFLLLAGFVIMGLKRGKAVLVLGGSAALWLVPQVVDFEVVWKAFHVNSAALAPTNWLSWQLLFVLGSVIGHEALVRERADRFFEPRLVRLAIAICLACFAGDVYLRLTESPYIAHKVITEGVLVHKWHLGPLRVLNFLAFALGVAALVRKAPRAFTSAPLAFLGRYSLQAYALHVPLVYVARYLRAVVDKKGGSLGVDLALNTALVALVCLGVWGYHRVKQLETRALEPA